jgi:hypothetical protein
MSDELEPEILSYRAFRNRETLLAWELRRRAIDAQAGRRSKGEEFLKPPRVGSRRAEAPPPPR